MRTTVSIEYPCGYKYSVYMKTGFFEFGTAHADVKEMPKCPLHGTKCK